MAIVFQGAPRTAKRNPTQRARRLEHALGIVLLLLFLILLVLMVRSLTTDANPLPAVMSIAGLVLLCFFYAYVFVLPDDLTSIATDRTLGIASRLFDNARLGFSHESMDAVCAIVLPETLAAAICFTDGSTVVASTGERSSEFPPGAPITLSTTGAVIASGETTVFASEACPEGTGLPLPLHAGIVAPLKVGDDTIGTMELYYRRQGEVDQRQLALATGFAKLLSAQLATFELERQSEISARVELKALQSQVDPHFLFNTLGTIVSLVRTDPEKARSLIIHFSDYYRQTLSDSDKPVTVAQEIAQAMRYATLMQARYGADRLSVKTHVADEAAARLVPSFILQPLFENSIKHGMREIGTLHITLRAHLIEGGLALCVEDDGVGMSRETAQALFDANRQRSHQADGESKGAGLALSNVLARIHLFFGPDSRIDVESTEGVGTKVTIILMGEPMELLMKEDRHVERTHS